MSIDLHIGLLLLLTEYPSLLHIPESWQLGGRRLGKVSWTTSSLALALVPNSAVLDFFPTNLPTESTVTLPSA